MTQVWERRPVTQRQATFQQLPSLRASQPAPYPHGVQPNRVQQHPVLRLHPAPHDVLRNSAKAAGGQARLGTKGFMQHQVCY
jgi:hypothetical protein